MGSIISMDIMKIVRILAVVTLFYNAFVFAEAGEPYNYYVPAPDRLLENVEKYHLQKGISLVKKGQFEYAWSEFAFMLHYFPNHPHALQLISDLALQMEDNTRALKYFERAMKLYPNEAPTYALYGIYLHKTGKIKQAIEYYQKAVKLDDKPAEYHYNLGLAYFALQEMEQSYMAAQKAYQRGYPLPGLKDKLIAKGIWKDNAERQSS